MYPRYIIATTAELVCHYICKGMTMSHSVAYSRTIKGLLVFLALLLLNCVFHAVAKRMPGTEQREITAILFMGNLLLHLLLGGVTFVILFRIGKNWRKAVRETAGIGRVFGIIAMLAVNICVLTGIALVLFGNLRPMRPISMTHGLSMVVAALSGALWLAMRYSLFSKHKLTEASQTQSAPRTAFGLIGLAIVPGFALLLMASKSVEEAAHIENPPLAPVSMEYEGDGPRGKFWPSSVQTVDNKFFPSEYFTDNKSCGEKGCHPDIYAQWESSAHRKASFNNQWYRKAVEYMQEVLGTQPSKWCGGCHDMAVLLTEMPGTGKSRMDFPIKDQIYPKEKFIESHTGISCSACHSVVHVKSTMGNGDYTIHYPPMHKYVISDNPLLKATTKFLTRLSPEPHRKTFLKPFHTQDTAKFCSSCHKVHLDIPVNNFRWFRGFNDYDAWQASGVSGQGARSFYYPSKDGKPDFKKCVDCHMPLVRSNDAGNKNGFVKSHRFLAANTALPYVYHDKEQLELTQKFLRDGALTIDIFALRREQRGVPRGTPKPNTQHRGRPVQPDQPQAANLFGEVATTGHAGPLMGGNGRATQETVIAPLDRGPVAVRRGEDVLIEVVVRTRKVGHAFPGGTFDAFDVWVELQAKDEKGKILLWSGNLQWPDGPVEKSAHQYRALLVDGASNAINKRNAWAARARIYARAIPPGAADTVHYRLHIPPDCGNKIVLTAKLNYRKFSWYNTHFAFAGRPVMDGDPNYSKGGIIEGTAIGKDASGKSKSGGPVTVHYDNRPFRFDADMKVVAAKDTSRIPSLPITVLCENTVTLHVTNGNPEAATTPRKLDIQKDRERWNDYGIGLMLQGDFRRATEAFKKVTQLSPDWPEGYVNIGRVRLLEGDNAEAKAMLEKALAMYQAQPPAVPPAMIPYLRARTQFFYGMALKNLGQYDRALAVWAEAARIFPNDRELRNQIGRVHFLSARFDQAIAEFQHVLTIDPEDLTAHYNLMLCYRGKGPAFKRREQHHQTLYYRFKADETTTHLQGPYKRRNPEDNLESQPIHEHQSAKSPLPGPPDMVKRLLPQKTVSKAAQKAVYSPSRG